MTMTGERPAPAPLAVKVAARLDMAADALAGALNDLGTARQAAQEALGHGMPLTSAEQAQVIASAHHVLAAMGAYQSLALLVLPTVTAPTEPAELVAVPDAEPTCTVDDLVVGQTFRLDVGHGRWGEPHTVHVVDGAAALESTLPAIDESTHRYVMDTDGEVMALRRTGRVQVLSIDPGPMHTDQEQAALYDAANGIGAGR